MTEVPGAMPTVRLSAEEVSKHHTKDTCWLTIRGSVFDVTSFVQDHPGGSAILLRNAGGDVTEMFEELHSPSIMLKVSIPDPRQKARPRLSRLLRRNALNTTDCISIQDWRYWGRNRACRRGD